MNLEDKVKSYMRANVGDHVDPLTDEVDTTSLAEDAWCNSKLGTSKVVIPEEWFDWAHEVGIEYEESIEDGSWWNEPDNDSTTN